MTPKEKAIELVDKYENMAWGNTRFTRAIRRKKCAEICVDEMIAALNRYADYWDLKNGEWYKDEINHLEAVKKEINAL